MLTLIDNYDSFTYNLVHYLGDLGTQCRVLRNDQASVAEVMRTPRVNRDKFEKRTCGMRSPAGTEDAGVSRRGAEYQEHRPARPKDSVKEQPRHVRQSSGRALQPAQFTRAAAAEPRGGRRCQHRERPLE